MKKERGFQKIEQMFEISFKPMPIHWKTYQENIFQLIHVALVRSFHFQYLGI